MFKINIQNLNATEIQIWLNFLEEFLNEKSHRFEFIFKTLIYVIFFVSLFGNLLTCVVIYLDRTMHTTTNYYLFNLAISDLIVSFAIFLDLIEPPKFLVIYSRIACKVYYLIVMTLWNNGVLILTAIAVERYLGICHPFKRKKAGWRGVTKIILLVWFIAIVEALPEAYLVDLIIFKNGQICCTVPTPMGKLVAGVMALLCFILPLGIMTFVYVMIAFKVNVIQKDSSRGNNFNYRDYRRKVNKLIVALTLSFLLCWLPFFICRTVFFFDVHQITKLKFWWRFVFNATIFCNWFSTVLNPLLFSLMSSKFRKALKKLWNKNLRNQREEDNNTVSNNFVTRLM